MRANPHRFPFPIRVDDPLASPKTPLHSKNRIAFAAATAKIWLNNYDWNISPDDGNTWVTAGSSNNQAYLTLRASVAPFLWHTLVHIGSTNSVGATTDDAVILGSWSEYTDNQVKRVDGTTLTYYASYRTQSVTTASLLATTDGECRAWTRFYLDVLKAQGIRQDDNYVSVTPTNAEGAVIPNHGFLIGNWNFAGNGGDLGIGPDFRWLNIEADPFVLETSYSWIISQVTDLPGRPGQGVDNPASLFHNHQLVHLRVNGASHFFDPSYGKDYASLTAWGNVIVGYFAEATSAQESFVHMDLNGDGDTNDTYVGHITFFRKSTTDVLEVTPDFLSY